MYKRQILKRYNEKYPKEQLKIVEMDSAQVVLRVIDHMVDVGLTGTTLEKKHCKYVPFYKDQLVVITPNTEKYRRLGEESAGDISWICKESFIMREEGSGTRKDVYKRHQMDTLPKTMLFYNGGATLTTEGSDSL